MSQAEDDLDAECIDLKCMRCEPVHAALFRLVMEHWKPGTRLEGVVVSRSDAMTIWQQVAELGSVPIKGMSSGFSFSSPFGAMDVIPDARCREGRVALCWTRW